MYWTSERIKKDLDRWYILKYEESYVLMGHLNDIAEIYTIETTDKHIGECLLFQISAHAFSIGKTGVLCMVENDASLQLQIVKTVGFKPCGRYVAYRTVIK